MTASRLSRCWQLLRYFGPKWLMYRAYHAARLKSGLLRWQLPPTTWDEQPLAKFLTNPLCADPGRYAERRRTSSPRFFFEPTATAKFRSCFQGWDTSEVSPLVVADDLCDGFVQFFSHERVDVGFPPRWHANPVSGHSFPSDRHWSQIGDFGAGDIKLVWEANRFGFVFPLVRSYWRTGDEQYAELFWQLVESWHLANPPEMGVNWKCGQEISLRVMAWCFGLYGFGSSATSTPDRVAMLAQMIAVSGRRIESNIGYALSQQNNHGLSEAMGLWTVGCLFPEFSDSARWAAYGRQLLERQARELIYDDGAFSQHSMNYHRVMLHDYLWSIRLGDVLEKPLTNALRDRIAKAGEFVYQLQDESTGRVPCYGQDDGALILPLNNCRYRDYRPIVQATHFLATGRRRLEPGPWDEDLLWLFGIGDTADLSRREMAHGGESRDRSKLPSHADSASNSRSPSRGDFEAPDGGYATLRSRHGYAITRAASFRHRPSQADMLHIDIWWRGENIAIDPGTYSYNAPPPWNNPFAHTAYHNTVTVDGLDQMERAGRFLWLPWLNGKSFGLDVCCKGDASCWNGEHDGYRRLPDPITHRRSLIRLGADHWLVIDALSGRQSHTYRLHWLLLDAIFEMDLQRTSIELETSVGQYRLAAAASEMNSRFGVTRAASDSAIGWSSAYYHSREPALSVSLEATASKIVFATLLGPDAEQPTIQHDRVHVSGADWTADASINLTDSEGMPLVSSVVVSGSLMNSEPSTTSLLSRSLPELHRCTFC